MAKKGPKIEYTPEQEAARDELIQRLVGTAFREWVQAHSSCGQNLGVTRDFFQRHARGTPDAELPRCDCGAAPGDMHSESCARLCLTA